MCLRSIIILFVNLQGKNMPTKEFKPLMGESTLFRTTPNRKWFAIAWNITSGVLGIAIVTFLLFSFLANPTENLLSSFLPVAVAKLITKFLFLGLIPLAGIAWVVEDTMCTFIGEAILTNQRIWMHGSPYAWSQSSIPLEDISSLTSRRDAIFIKQKSTRKILVQMVSDSKTFVQTYRQFIGKSKTT